MTNDKDKNNNHIQKYEYAFITSIHATNWAEIHDMPEDSRPEQTWTDTFYIFWPGKKDYEERSGKDLTNVTLFNELGQDGWKLVSHDTPNSHIPGGAYFGWYEVSRPVRERFIFIREVLST